jgi:hypothetical protein
VFFLIGAGLLAQPGEAEEERQRRSIFGIHNLNFGDFDTAVENMEWTRHLVGRGWVFEWVRDGAWEDWIAEAFRLNLVPCIRIQEGAGGETPSPAHARTVAEKILNYKIAHPVDAFGERWYRWPEILAVHPFLLAHPGWEAFAWVPISSCNGSPSPGCNAHPRCSQDCDGDGLREPKAARPQYEAVRQLRIAREASGMLPARATPYRGPAGTIRGRITRADTGERVPYATVRTDGYAFGHVSLYDGGYEVHGVPAGSYTLTGA